MEPYITLNTLEAKTRDWLLKIAPYNIHTMELKTEKAAILVIDMQKFFLEPGKGGFTCGGPIILPNVKALIQAFRQARRPVIYTCHVHRSDGADAGNMKWWWDSMCVEGTPESQIAEDISPTAGDKVIYKHRYSAFYNTDLETILRGYKIEDLVITGVMTNMCCESTARDAYFRDYRIFFPADANGTINEEMHLASLLNLSLGFAHITTSEDIICQILRH